MTGETLVRSALAPMFGSRRLNVLAWSGTKDPVGTDEHRLAAQYDLLRTWATRWGT